MDKIFTFLDLLNRSLTFLEGIKLPKSFCKKNNNTKQIVKKIIKVKIENLNPIVSTSLIFIEVSGILLLWIASISVSYTHLTLPTKA